MIELLIGFLAGSVATTYVGRKARQWKSKGRAPAATPSPSNSPSTEWSGKQCCAIILMSLPPEVSTILFSNLAAEEVQTITTEIVGLPLVRPEAKKKVLSYFCGSLGIAESRLHEAAKDEPSLVAKALRGLLQQTEPFGA